MADELESLWTLAEEFDFILAKQISWSRKFPGNKNVDEKTFCIKIEIVEILTLKIPGRPQPKLVLTYEGL